MSIFFFMLIGLVILAGLIDSKVDYIFVMVGLFATILVIFSKPSVIFFHRKYVVFNLFQAIPVSMFFVWLYGVFIGLILDNNVLYVFSNFAGISTYLIFYFFLVVRPRFNSIAKLFFYLALFVSFFIFFQFLTSLSRGLFNYALGFSSGRVYMTSVSLIIAPFLSLYFSYWLLGLPNTSSTLVKKIIDSNLLFVFFIFVLVVPAASKGFLLSVVLLFVLSIFASLLKLVKYLKVQKSSVYVFFTVLFIVIILFNSFYEELALSFALGNNSNDIRITQFYYLVKELKFMGNGLGAVLESGYARDDTGYGFELTYINLLHKLGVFATIIFVSYFLTLSFGFVMILRRDSRIVGAFVIGCMAYLIPGLGNPILFSPQMVILHCVAMYLIMQWYGPNRHRVFY